MNSYFVDKAGRIHCGNSAGIKALVPTRPDSFQAQQQLSVVAGVQARRGLAAIRVIPDRLSYAAYATLATLLETFAPERIALSWHQGGWHDEIIGRTASAAWHCAGQRVLALMTKARLEHDDRYQISTGSVDDIPSAGGMRRLIELWRFSGLNIDMAAQRQQVSELLGGKYYVIRSGPNATPPILDMFGPGWDIYQDRTWVQRSVGRPVTDQPDVRYGQWLSGNLQCALEADSPTLCDVEAVISDPRTLLRMRRNYKRLTLPLRLAGGEQGALVTSLTTHAPQAL